MKKIKSVSSKATHKLKRTLSKLTHKGQHQRSSAAERDMELAQGVRPSGGPLDFHTSQEAPAPMEWAAAAGVMPRDQWAMHMRELEESGVVQAETRSLSGSSARRGDDEAGYEEDTRREEERRRRREKREKEARRRRRERKEAEEDKIARRHSRHSNRSKRSSSSSSDQESSSNSKEAAEKAWEERHRERQREKRRRREREAEHGGRRRERRSVTAEAIVYAGERTLSPPRTADQDVIPNNGVLLLPDYEPQVPMEEDEEEAFYRPASTASEEEVLGPVPLAELAEDALDEPRVKSPARDRPSGRDEGGDDEDGFEDYDYASSGPLGGPGGVNTESDGSLVVPTSLDRLPQLVSPGSDLGRHIVTSLGASPPPDLFSGESDDDNNAAETAMIDATAPVGTGGVEGVAEQPEVALMSPKKSFHTHPAEPIGKPLLLPDAAERVTSDADARRESAPSGDAAFS